VSALQCTTTLQLLPALLQAVAMPLSKALRSFQYVPPVAVATTGLAYLALANLLHKMAVVNLWERSADKCALFAQPTCKARTN
jgi:hypothetical protein